MKTYQYDTWTHRCTASLLLRIPSRGTPATGTQLIGKTQTKAGAKMGAPVTLGDVHVYLPDCDRSRTASQCWGDLLARAAGAEGKREKMAFLVYSAFIL